MLPVLIMLFKGIFKGGIMSYVWGNLKKIRRVLSKVGKSGVKWWIATIHVVPELNNKVRD